MIVKLSEEQYRALVFVLVLGPVISRQRGFAHLGNLHLGIRHQSLPILKVEINRSCQVQVISPRYF